eukprot:10049630-Heterocapsa_arctica.AAC.1
MAVPMRLAEGQETCPISYRCSPYGPEVRLAGNPGRNHCHCRHRLCGMSGDAQVHIRKSSDAWGHCVRTWSTTRSVITFSSGEAELYGIVKGASAAMGFQSIAADLGVKLDIIIFSDSAAARGMVRRTGLGKVRHIHVQELWVQQALREGRFGLNPISGVDNPVDILT